MVYAHPYRVDVLVNGNFVTNYTHKGDRFIEGRAGSNYQIRLNNPTGTRVKAIVSVDGLSVMDGQPASESSSGYIIPAYGSIDIGGWRVSDDKINQFVFGDKRASYSNKSGQGTANTGVIGVMFFKERVIQPAYPWPYVFGSAANYPNDGWSVGSLTDDGGAFYGSVGINAVASNASSGSMRSVSKDLGTGFGESQQSRVRTVDFNSEVFPDAQIVIYYDDRRGLEARGIVVDKRFDKPDPFPASTKYCKPV